MIFMEPGKDSERDLPYDGPMPGTHRVGIRHRLIWIIPLIVVIVGTAGYFTIRAIPASDNAGGKPGTSASGNTGAGQNAADSRAEKGAAGFGAGPSGSASLSPKGTLSPSPAFSEVCPAFPGFPDASCTGWQHTGVKLHTNNCPGKITKPNSTYDGCLFKDGIAVAAGDVTIKRSRIEGIVGQANSTGDGDLNNLQLIDVEIDGGGNPDFNQAAIGISNYSCVRCNIHSTGRGANIGQNVTFRESYIHDFVYSNGAHQTAIGSHGGGNYSIVHNNLQCNSNSQGCSSALSFYGDDAQVNGALVQNNLFNTDGSYCTYAGSVQGKAYPHGINIRYIDNRFGKKFGGKCAYYGPVACYEDNPGNVWQGNSWQDGSGAVAKY
jgi:hypothetical protein